MKMFNRKTSTCFESKSSRLVSLLVTFLTASLSITVLGQELSPAIHIGSLGNQGIAGGEFSPDSNFVVTYGQESFLFTPPETSPHVSVYDSSTGNLLVELPISASSLSFSPDSNTLATGGEDGEVKIWNIPSGELVASLAGRVSLDFEGQGRAVDILSFSSSGSVIWAFGGNSTIRVWNVSDRALVSSFKLVGYSGFNAEIDEVYLSKDGEFLLTAGDSNQGGIRLYNTKDGGLERVFGDGTNAYYNGTARFSPDSSLVIGNDSPEWPDSTGAVRIWTTQDGSLLRTLAGHSDRLIGTEKNGHGIL